MTGICMCGPLHSPARSRPCTTHVSHTHTHATGVTHTRVQVDKDMIEVLQVTWLDGHLAALREEGKKYEK